MKLATPKKALYAAVGAPVVTARRLGDKVSDLRSKLAKDARDEYTTWAAEGEKLVAQLTDRKMVEDLAARVDFDQFQEQVGKLRDQLEDMLKTWRSSFNPEKQTSTRIEVETPAPTPPTKTTTRKPAAKKAPAKTTARKPAAKKAPAKTTARKPAAKAG